ncbi:hypothetical protein MKZ38_003975 [Zalerion maritima]|uniref:Uncharacterized protein n=1 Tax=Zalerion maritima TaxID=339359 RepID=A0AAD5RM23_9PEZI|nr:hypothetical protein MKZ38_003975 [Zalerion maritima]
MSLTSGACGICHWAAALDRGNEAAAAEEEAKSPRRKDRGALKKGPLVGFLIARRDCIKVSPSQSFFHRLPLRSLEHITMARIDLIKCEVDAHAGTCMSPGRVLNPNDPGDPQGSRGGSRDDSVSSIITSPFERAWKGSSSVNKVEVRTPNLVMSLEKNEHCIADRTCYDRVCGETGKCKILTSQRRRFGGCETKDGWAVGELTNRTPLPEGMAGGPSW